jgi:AraC-like DNA-binding protein
MRVAIGWIETHYDQGTRIDALAKHVGMSVASLNRHFRAVTGIACLACTVLCWSLRGYAAGKDPARTRIRTACGNHHVQRYDCGFSRRHHSLAL